MEALQRIKLQLANTAQQYAASDGAGVLFETWYDLAKQYAAGSNVDENEMIQCTVETFKMILYYEIDVHLNCDEYCIRELHDTCQKICGILRQKVKFTQLFTKESKEFWEVLEIGYKRLCEVLTQDGMNAAGVRYSAAQTMYSIVVTVDYYNGMFDVPVEFEYVPVVQMAIRQGSDSVVRSEAMMVVRGLSKLYHFQILQLLVKHAMDVEGLLPIWSLQALNHPSIVDMLKERITKPSVDMNFSDVVLNSLYEAIVNKNVHDNYVDADEGTFPAFVLDTKNVALYTVLSAIQTVYIQKQTKGNEKQDIMDTLLQVVETVLKQDPNYVALLGLLCENPTYHGMLTLVGCSEVFSENTWIYTLLPFIRTSIANMSDSGVSGNLTHQEIIHLLREACRLYYLNHDRSPSVEFGYHLFISVTQAVRHGYYETERFTEILASIALYHIPMEQESVATWVVQLLLPSVSHNYKTTRAFHEVIISILGLSSSSFGTEFALLASSTDPTLLQHLACSLTSIRSKPGDELWMTMFQSYGKMVDSDQNITKLLLTSIETEVNTMIKLEGINLVRLSSIAELLIAISTRNHIQHFANLFDITVKVMMMHPDGATLYADDTLIAILDSAQESNGEISDCALLGALEYFGVPLRVKIATVRPDLCLLDDDPEVRVMALSCIMQTSTKIPQHRDQILHSCSEASFIPIKTEDRTEKIAMQSYALACASCPVLAELAIQDSQTLCSCIAIIVRMADECAINDAMGQPYPVTKALNRIGSECSSTAVLNFLSSTEGQLFTPSLVKYSSKFAHLATQVDTNKASQDLARLSIGTPSKLKIAHISPSTPNEQIWSDLHSITQNGPLPQLEVSSTQVLDSRVNDELNGKASNTQV